MGWLCFQDFFCLHSDAVLRSIAMAPIKSLYSFSKHTFRRLFISSKEKTWNSLCLPKVDYAHVDKLLDTVKVMSWDGPGNYFLWDKHVSTFLSLDSEIFLSSHRLKKKKKHDILLAPGTLLFHDGCVPSRKRRLLLGLIH